MKRIIFTSLFTILVVFAFSQPQPNIVVLFSDDAGYADFGFHGSQTMLTPHLDKLASEGIVCTQAYVTDPTCGPSRAGLMTGRYQQRFGFEENNVPGFMSAVSAADGAEMGMPTDEKMMAEYLRELGYTTGYFGKWHLGGTESFHPIQRGYDHFYGFRAGARSYFAYPEPPVDTLRRMERGYADFKEFDGYLTDVLAKDAVDFIDENKEAPFFAFVAFNAVHTPMDALDSDLAQFPTLDGNRKIMAAMNLAMDRACGLILQKLKEEGLEDNTIVIFTNDNGGPTDRNASSNFPLSGTKSNHLEGGIRVPFVIRWPDQLRGGREYPFPISTLDLLPTFLDAAQKRSEVSTAIDGVNLLPFLKNLKVGRPHARLFWKKDCRATIREGDWKLMRFPDRPAELYNIESDPREEQNLAADYPDKVKDLFKTIFAWESTLERPRWLLHRKYENVDLDRMDAFRDQGLFFRDERTNK